MLLIVFEGSIFILNLPHLPFKNYKILIVGIQIMQNANIFRATEYSKDDPSLKSADH